MCLAVIKEGPKCDAQLEYLERLVAIAPDRFPKILHSWSGGYAMEMLRPFEPTAWWPGAIEVVLKSALWSRPSVVKVFDDEWQDVLWNTLRMTPPSWAWNGVSLCATHGDPTMCNTMRRGSTDYSDIMLVDPVHPERVPSIRQIDQAKILQTMLGWEIMTGFQEHVLEWVLPGFISSVEDYDRSISVTLFWTTVVMARIAASANTTESEKAWARHLRSEIEGVLP